MGVHFIVSQQHSVLPGIFQNTLVARCSLEAIPTQEAVQPPKQNSAKEISECHITEDTVVGEAKPARKRKERHESGSYHSQSHERKVIRSNSEERPQAPEGGRRRDESSIRRVSSHEDFTLAKNQHNISIHHHSHHGSHRHHGTSLGSSATGHRSSKTKNFLSELIDPANKQPSLTACQVGGEPICGSLLHSGTISSGNYGNDEDNFSEHERRRHSERLCRAGARPRGRSNHPRRRRRHRETNSNLSNTTGRNGVASSSVISAAEAVVAVSANSTDSNHYETRGSSSKENEDVEDESGSGQSQQLTPVSSSTSTSSEESNPELVERNKDKHGFLQLHQDEIRERSPSPAASPSTPPLDLTTLHEQVDSSEPLTSQSSSWSHSRVEQEQNEPVPSSQAVLSPRNSLIWTRHVYLDPSVPPSPPNEHARGRAHGPEAEARLGNCNKQLVLLKKKIKLYEEEFERDNGYRPSHLDKFENKEVKKICLELSKLRRELKMLKDEPQSVIQKDSGHLNSRSKNNIEQTVVEIEKHLYDKRTQACRPEPLDQLNRQQVIDEKVSVQKALLFLESIHGRPTVKTARDLVRPLYDRYRTLKRMIVRQGPSKMKDSISELATILEHEAMEFTSSSPPPPAITPTGEDSPEEKPSEITDNDVAINSAEDSSTINSGGVEPSEKLHALPLAELQAEQRAAREEKRRLRRQLRDFEEEITGRTGKKLQREDRLPLEQTYQAYKQAKARLRLLEALVAKNTQNFNK